MFTNGGTLLHSTRNSNDMEMQVNYFQRYLTSLKADSISQFLENIKICCKVTMNLFFKDVQCAPIASDLR